MADHHKKRLPGTVLEILQGATSGKKIREPNLAELAQHFFDIAGGERAVAKMLWDEYNRTDCLASVRAKIMQFMLQHLKWLNEKSGNIDELGVLNDDDLSKMLDNHIRQVSADVLKQQKEAKKKIADEHSDEHS